MPQPGTGLFSAFLPWGSHFGPWLLCGTQGKYTMYSSPCLDAGQSKCRLERAQALEQAKKPQEAVFVPECGEDGSFTQFLISDRDPPCNPHCPRTQPKPICASDGRSYESMCEYQRAKCRDPALAVVHRGRCKGECVRSGGQRLLGLQRHKVKSSLGLECLCSSALLSLSASHQGVREGRMVRNTSLIFRHCHQ